MIEIYPISHRFQDLGLLVKFSVSTGMRARGIFSMGGQIGGLRDGSPPARSRGGGEGLRSWQHIWKVIDASTETFDNIY